MGESNRMNDNQCRYFSCVALGTPSDFPFYQSMALYTNLRLKVRPIALWECSCPSYFTFCCLNNLVGRSYPTACYKTLYYWWIGTFLFSSLAEFRNFYLSGHFISYLQVDHRHRHLETAAKHFSLKNVNFWKARLFQARNRYPNSNHLLSWFYSDKGYHFYICRSVVNNLISR